MELNHEQFAERLDFKLGIELRSEIEEVHEGAEVEGDDEVLPKIEGY